MLSNGDISVSVQVTVDAASATAKTKIEGCRRLGDDRLEFYTKGASGDRRPFLFGGGRPVPVSAFLARPRLRQSGYSNLIGKQSRWS